MTEYKTDIARLAEDNVKRETEAVRRETRQSVRRPFDDPGLASAVITALTRAYNDIGVRRWFHRPRERLDGNTPSQVLDHEWSSGDDGPRRVRDLARALASSPAT
ncbi:MAG: DUF2384 domain-containing protein [Alphaproteobacteria bacterium]|nr:DUF2384 domain-containing protein [Alphaproteobacteria bacterium]MCY4320694.1 DUF2384 domain-containing protein [Alphaproteobacteria bacterium]